MGTVFLKIKNFENKKKSVSSVFVYFFENVKCKGYTLYKKENVKSNTYKIIFFQKCQDSKTAKILYHKKRKCQESHN